jgi:hypothetical protein
MVCPINYKDPPIYGGMRTPSSQQLHFFLPQRTTLHTFQGHYSNYGFVRNFQRVFARSNPFTRCAFCLSLVHHYLHLGSTNVPLYARPLTNMGHQSGSPFGADAPRSPLRLLEGSGAPSPALASRHLQSPHTSREQGQYLISLLKL